MPADPSNSVASPNTPASVRSRVQLPPARVTPILIGLNVAVFLFMLLRGVSATEPTIDQLLAWGANFGPADVAGQWWRLLTACFLHIGFIHIAFNMYVLYQAGPFVERLFGPARYTALYLLAGVAGNLLGVFLHPNVVSAGASGAIFGVYGALLGFLLKERAALRPEAVRSIGQSALVFIGFNLFYGFASAHTDMTAHVGGLVAGFLAGYFFARPLQVVAVSSASPRTPPPPPTTFDRAS